MFAVPGWSVSADTLQTQRPGSGQTSEKPSKKRKRSHGRKDGKSVDVDRLPELWERHIEKKAPSLKGKEESASGTSRREKRKKRPRGEMDQSGEAKNPEDQHGSQATKPKAEGGKAAKVPGRETESSKESGAKKALPPAAQASKLTPLQSSMRDKLISSRFRYLNETLYTTPSQDSLKLFADNPTFFDEYHQGFRRQVDAWPENPVDGFVRWIRERGPLRPLRNPRNPAKGHAQGTSDPRGEGSPEPTPSGPEPLPREPHSGLCTIADLGCGDARLAQTLTAAPPAPPLARALKLRVHSFDLAASSPRVTVADMRHLPLADASVDVAVFCLALMGTNWVAFVEEAWRVLRPRGECWVAEVGSRFGTPGSGPGKTRGAVKEKDGRGGKGKGGTENGRDENEPGTVGEVTSVPRSGPDVAAFVAVLGRRGFVLRGEADVSNKMFVRMRFVKVGNPLHSKAGNRPAPRGKKWAQDVGDALDSEEEAKTLKPCVYKTR